MSRTGSEIRHLATRHTLGFWVGLAGLAIIAAAWRPSLAPDAGADPRQLAAVAALAWLMAVWWMTEAVPIPVTSLLPMVLLPLLAGPPFDLARVAANYANWRVFLFFGGFLIAIAMEETGLHRRIALRTVQTLGTQPARIVLGFMVASAGLSMWISNTATALMMLPIGQAVIGHFAGRRDLGVALMLGIAYGASIGGIATPIGTPPNIAFQGVYAGLFPEAPPIGFAQWMAYGLPLVAIMLPVAWWLLVRGLRSREGDAAEVVAASIERQGATSVAQRRVAIVFTVTAALWLFRRPIDLELFRIPGWSGLFPGAAINDGVVAMGMGLLLFLLPGGRGKGPLLNWSFVREKMPWGILILFGGGFALADAIGGSGLAAWLGASMGFMAGLHPLVLIGGAAALLTFLTEVTSNTATAQVMLPLAAAIAVTTVGVHPLLLMLPVTVAASFAFMLPVATPPNAVVFGSGAVPMGAMIRHGLRMNLIAIAVLTLVTWLLGGVVFGIDPAAGVPSWALPD